MTTLTDGAVLHAAILADPDDDLVRLACADWLEENGDLLRAEFIRVQIAIHASERDCRCGRKVGGHAFTGGQHHNGPCAADQLRVEADGRHIRARVREAELLCDSLKWLDRPLADVESETAGAACIWRRGFVEEIHCTLDVFMRLGKTAMATPAPIRRVRLIDKKPVQGGWQWAGWRWVIAHDGENAAPRWALPRQLFRLLLDDEMATVDASGTDDASATFDSEQEAQDALSNACLTFWGRTP